MQPNTQVLYRAYIYLYLFNIALALENFKRTQDLEITEVSLGKLCHEKLLSPPHPSSLIVENYYFKVRNIV